MLAYLYLYKCLVVVEHYKLPLAVLDWTCSDQLLVTVVLDLVGPFFSLILSAPVDKLKGLVL